MPRQYRTLQKPESPGPLPLLLVSLRHGPFSSLRGPFVHSWGAFCVTAHQGETLKLGDCEASGLQIRSQDLELSLPNHAAESQ